MADPWSWKTVFETLLGTGIGACVGVGGIAWQTRHQNKTDYETRLTSNLFEACEIFNSILNSPEIRQRWRLVALDSQSLRFKNIGMLCKEGDQVLLLLLSEICFELAQKAPDVKSNVIAEMMGAITGWRSGLEPRDNYIQSLTRVLVETQKYPAKEAPDRTRLTLRNRQ